MRRFLAMPFIIIGIPIFALGVIIRFGLEDTSKIFESLNKTLVKIKGK